MTTLPKNVRRLALILGSMLVAGPPVTVLTSAADEYGVAYVTVRQAMQVLREQGLIVTIHGRGTFVAASLRSGTDQTG